jgi:hypothetical protein
VSAGRKYSYLLSKFDQYKKREKRMRGTGRISGNTLRGYLWSELARREGPLDSTALNCGPELSYANSNRSAKWARRESVPQLKSAKKHMLSAPMSFLLFTSAPFELLNNTRLSTLRINYLMSVDELERRALKEDVHGERVFEDISNLDGWRVRGNSKDLVRRGDLLAFFTILATVRQAEWDRDYATHIAEMANLYRCLPGLGRYPWLRPDFGLLCRLVLQVHARVDITQRFLGVDWQILFDQFNDSNFEPDPCNRPVDPETGRPVGVASVVRIARSPSVGDCPPWPVRPAELGPQANTSIPSSIEMNYSEICRSHTDQLLFTSFMQTAHLWQIPRKDWEGCLGVSGPVLHAWIARGIDQLSPVARRRIIAINRIRERFACHRSYREDWAGFVHEKADQLGLRSVVELLRNGAIEKVANYSSVVAADYTQKADSTSELIPLVSYAM